MSSSARGSPPVAIYPRLLLGLVRLRVAREAHDGRAIRPPEASGWLERRTAGAAAVRALKGDAAEVAAPPPSVPRAAPVVADQGSEGD